MSGRDTALARARLMRGSLLEAGVPEVSIEIQIGRPGPADPWNGLSPVGVLSHHIASYPTAENPTPGLSLVKVGRSDLPGPLCNGTAGVDLVYRIICLGYANHSGYGGSWSVSGPLGTYVIPKDNGRAYLWGTEYEGGYDDATWDRTYTNRRTGISMTFREFMGRANVGLSRGIWLINGRGREPQPSMDLSGYHGEHSTWTTRKVDRRGYTTESGRAEMRLYNQPPEEPMTPQDVWAYGIKPLAKSAKTIPARMMLAQAHKRSGEARANSWAASKNAETALDVARANARAIRALGRSLEPTVRDAVEDALRDVDTPRKVTAADAPADDDE